MESAAPSLRRPMLISPLQFDFGAIATDTSILSSIAIILGSVFVVYQIRQDEKMLQSSVRQADANSEQAKLTMKQFVQNNELATVDLVLRMYEFADSMEVQRSFVTVVRSKIGFSRTSSRSRKRSSSRSSRSPRSSSRWGSWSRRDT